MNSPSGYLINQVVTYLQAELGLDEMAARRHGSAMADLVYAQAAAEGIAEATNVRGQYDAQRARVSDAEGRAVKAHEALRYYALCGDAGWDGGARAVRCIGPQR